MNLRALQALLWGTLTVRLCVACASSSDGSSSPTKTPADRVHGRWGSACVAESTTRLSFAAASHKKIYGFDDSLLTMTTAYFSDPACKTALATEVRNGSALFAVPQELPAGAFMVFTFDFTPDSFALRPATADLTQEWNDQGLCGGMFVTDERRRILASECGDTKPAPLAQEFDLLELKEEDILYLGKRDKTHDALSVKRRPVTLETDVGFSKL